MSASAPLFQAMVETEQATPNRPMTDTRAALIEATMAEIVESGYTELTPERLAGRAGVSIATFRASFADEQVAVLAAHEAVSRCFEQRLLEACGTQPQWPLKVKVGIGVTLDLAASSPLAAQFLTLDTLVVDRELMRQMLESRDRLSRLLAAGRAEMPPGVELPAVVEQALVGGVGGVISSQLRSGQAEHLPALAPQLVELTLLPYLGSEAAAAVASRPLPDLREL